MSEHRAARQTNTDARTWRAYSEPLRAAYQGIEGAFGEAAVQQFWKGQTEAVASRSFEGALQQMLDGTVQAAVIPVWNSTIGPVNAARRAIDAQASSVAIVGEIDVAVQHCLLALPGTSRRSVRYVGSHPAALGQCAGLFASQPELVACEAFDTAGAARDLSLLQDPRVQTRPECWYDRISFEAPSTLAVIASVTAARRYGLIVLERGVQDDPHNLTRFVVLRPTVDARLATAPSPC